MALVAALMAALMAALVRAATLGLLAAAKLGGLNLKRSAAAFRQSRNVLRVQGCGCRATGLNWLLFGFLASK